MSQTSTRRSSLSIPLFVSFFTAFSLFLGAVTLLAGGDRVYAQGTNCIVQLGDHGVIARNPLARFEVHGLQYDGKIYDFGGFERWSRPAQQMQVYDPVTNEWTVLADIPKPLTHAGAAVDPATDTLWIVAGMNGYDPPTSGWFVTNEVLKYHIPTNTWSNGPALPEKRAGGSAFIVGRTLHFVGGFHADRMTNTGEHWTLNLDGGTTWGRAADFPRPRDHASIAEVNGKFYFLGGMLGHNGGPMNDVAWVDAYDPQTDTWEQLNDINRPRSHFEAGTTVYNGKIIMVGGRDNQEPDWQLDIITQYDPVTETETLLGTIPFGFGSLGAVGQVINGNLYITAGRTWGNSYYDTIGWRIPLSENCDEPQPDPTEEPQPDPTDEPQPDPTEEPQPDPTEEPQPDPAPETTAEPDPATDNDSSSGDSADDPADSANNQTGQDETYIAEVDSAAETGTYLAFDPFITKNADPPFAIPGERVTFTFVISNPASLPAQDVVAVDPMPAEITILSASAPTGTVRIEGQNVIFEKATLLPGEDVTVTIQTRVRDDVDTPYILINEVCVDGGDPTRDSCSTASVASVTSLPKTGEAPLTATLLRWSWVLLVPVLLAGWRRYANAR